MANPYSFKIGGRSVILNADRVDQFIKATSAKDAFRTKNGGLWARFCDFFCIGHDRNVIKKLFNSIVDAPGNASPAEQLRRFQKLVSYATEPKPDKGFHISVDAHNPSGSFWKYQFFIDNEPVYQSDWHRGDVGDLGRKDFCSRMTVFNLQQDINLLNNVPEHSREQYAIGELDTLSDNKNDTGEEGTSRSYLREHLHDSFFCSSNFKEIRKKDGGLLFDAVFSKGDEERVLQLSNRIPTSGEFRGATAQKAFQNQTYSDLYQLVMTNYGTENDTEMRYIARGHRMMLMNVIGNHIKDADVEQIMNTESVSRTNCPDVSVAKLIYL